MLTTVLIVLLVLLVVGVPAYGYNAGWSPGPSGVFVVLVIVLLVLLLSGRL